MTVATMLGILLAYLNVLEGMTKLFKEVIKEQNDLLNLESVADDGGILRPAGHQGQLELWEDWKQRHERTSHLPVLWHALLCTPQKVWRLAAKRKNEAVEVDGDLHEDNAIMHITHVQNMIAQLKLQRHGQQA